MPSMSGSRTRSAAELNEQIRALIVRSGGRLTGQQRAEYQALLLEWAAAVPDTGPDRHGSTVPDPSEEITGGPRVR